MSRFLKSIRAILPYSSNKAEASGVFSNVRREGANPSQEYSEYQETELFPKERFESLLKEEELGIVKSNCLNVLNQDPWNSVALKRMGLITNGLESLLYYHLRFQELKKLPHLFQLHFRCLTQQHLL